MLFELLTDKVIFKSNCFKIKIQGCELMLENISQSIDMER